MVLASAGFFENRTFSTSIFWFSDGSNATPIVC
jgi:hypothetical protein